MKALRADFAVRRPIGVWPWLALILAMSGFAAYQGWLGWVQMNRISALKIEQATLSQELDLAEQSQQQAGEKRKMTPPYAADAAAILKIASFPLNRVLASLESAQVLGVKITGLEALPLEGTVRVELEFTDHASLLSYIEAINAGEPTPHWVLVQAQVSQGVPASNSATLMSSWTVTDR